MNGFDNIVSQPNTEKHAISHSKMLAGVSPCLARLLIPSPLFGKANCSQYAGKENDFLESAVNTQALRLVNLIERKYLSTKGCYKPVDFAKVIPYFTLDAISGLAFGEPFGDLDEGVDKYDLKESSEALLPAMFFFAVFPWVTNFLQSRVMKNLGRLRWILLGLGG